MIAALFVETGGVYFGLPGVAPWDVTRDARLYAGPWPVVAHPPCARLCRLAGLVEARWGHKRGEDGGCFAAALEAVRTWLLQAWERCCPSAWDAPAESSFRRALQTMSVYDVAEAIEATGAALSRKGENRLHYSAAIKYFHGVLRRKGGEDA